MTFMLFFTKQEIWPYFHLNQLHNNIECDYISSLVLLSLNNLTVREVFNPRDIFAWLLILKNYVNEKIKKKGGREGERYIIICI